MPDEMGNIESSYYQPTEPEEQKKERLEEKAKANEAPTLIEDLLKRLDSELDLLKSNKEAIRQAKLREISIEASIHGLDIAFDRLAGMKGYLESLKEAYIKR